MQSDSLISNYNTDPGYDFFFIVWKVIPRAIDYFTGKALEWEEAEDDDFEDEEEFDDDEDDDEDEDDEDEDADVPAFRRRKGGKDNVDPQECKQQ